MHKRRIRDYNKFNTKDKWIDYFLIWENNGLGFQNWYFTLLIIFLDFFFVFSKRTGTAEATSSAVAVGEVAPIKNKFCAFWRAWGEEDYCGFVFRDWWPELIGNEERSYRKKVAGVDWCEEERQMCWVCVWGRENDEKEMNEILSGWESIDIVGIREKVAGIWGFKKIWNLKWRGKMWEYYILIFVLCECLKW